MPVECDSSVKTKKGGTVISSELIDEEEEDFDDKYIHLIAAH